MSAEAPLAPLDDALRELAPRVLGALLRRGHAFDAAEDTVQEALIAAFLQWPHAGVPANPGGWLHRVACRRLSDRIAAERARRAREVRVSARESTAMRELDAVDSADSIEQDDALVALFLCCHPALSATSAVALTLRTVGGLSTAAIASALLAPEATIAQRVVRAKRTLQEADDALARPDASQRAARLPAVLHVLYLIFNEGYAASAADRLDRVELCFEAIRLARLLHRLSPPSAEIDGLLALLVLTHARRAARVGSSGEVIPLDEQDRTRWDQAAIAEGVGLVTSALTRAPPGIYAVQAAIAAVHCEAAHADATDWPQILALYDVLVGLQDNPMAHLNRTVALAMVRGPRAGLERLEELAHDPRLARHHRLVAVRAHLLERAGDRDAAREQFEVAAQLTSNRAEHAYLIAKSRRMVTG